ncbi:Signal recognition particle receptor FtsY [Methylacidimicrobium cyclopophantes]|uniref:Signal recognition particle receptor FtsY n=1 Tax=Methylacidimicrobium cyclopophantes TaxID=1041766 RepID=A0A5E6MER2_9BACT|nr:signal recognition particle-docking protein FtsY [Methylacidimicrobium cyclopophantes]VVM06751.1 Signal recognition particle receptor FtsY [Methylacidimicrobium cyclopophantes]
MKGFWRKLVEKFSAGGGERVDWEALLLEADLGLALTGRLTRMLSEEGLLRKPPEGEERIRQELRSILAGDPPKVAHSEKPVVILLVGVNGGGKTTTAAKLAFRYGKEGKRVVLAAADTFRAAAVEQLEAWARRIGTLFVAGNPGADPASVAYRAHAQAEEEKADLLIVDTAGRLATKNNLMLEAAKIRRTLAKRDPQAPHHVWLVVDGTVGSNALSQATEFHRAVGLSGLIVTKLDGSAKGGMIAAVKEELGLPTVFVGIGEKLEDLEEFDADRYVDEFFGG